MHHALGVLTSMNVSILSSCLTGTSSTLSTDAYPPDSILQCFSMDWKICQPHWRYLLSPVRRYARKSDSTVSGLEARVERLQGLHAQVCRLTVRCIGHREEHKAVLAYSDQQSDPLNYITQTNNQTTYFAPLIYQSWGKDPTA